MIALDVETTGLDTFNGCRPFYVTTCDEDGDQLSWTWDVDPYTRQVSIPKADLDAISELIAGGVVGHNIKFDALMLMEAGMESWPWDITHDTTYCGHLLASDQRKDLTSQAMLWLGEDIAPFEKALGESVNAARRLARSKFPNWRIAREGDPMLPSCGKGDIWRSDLWLPGALARELGYPDDHPWHTVLTEYADRDSAVAMLLWQHLFPEVERRGLLPYYEQKRLNMRVLATMEQRGTTVLVDDLNDLNNEYRSHIEACTAACNRIASAFKYKLELPKGSSNNGSLTTFAFDVLKLPVVKRTPTGKPSLDKEVVEIYKRTLEGQQLRFITNLNAIRKRAKSCEFLETYKSYGTGSEHEGVLVLHPSVNPTATATTRLSMSNPNLQQVSKQESECDACEGEGCAKCNYTGEDLHSVRKVFGPAPGREWWSLDAKNIELRIPAYESGEPELIALFERPDDPPYYGSQHMLNMSIVYEDIWKKELAAVGLDKVGPHCKKKYASGPYLWSKSGGLAMQYQCGEETADRAFRRPGGFRKLKGFFSKVGRLNDKYVHAAQDQGFVETTPDPSIGATRGYPLVCRRGDWGRVLSTVPLNYHTQGTAGHWMVRAMNRSQELLDKWAVSGFDGYICLTVHDELVFDFPRMGDPIRDAEIEKKTGKLPTFRTSNLWRIRRIQAAMEQGGRDINVPTPVSCEYHTRCWAEGVPL